jgi:hypothetical protein
MRVILNRKSTVDQPFLATSEDHEKAFLRQLGEAVSPHIHFAVRGRLTELKTRRPMTVHHFTRNVGLENPVQHFLVAVLEITPQEALTLADQSREFYQDQLKQHRAMCDAQEDLDEQIVQKKEKRVQHFKFLQRSLVAASILATFVFMLLLMTSPAGAMEIVEVDVPPAQQLFLGVEQVPVNPTEVSFLVDGFEIVVSVIPQSDAQQNIPLDLYVAAGPAGSIRLGAHVPEPGTAAMLGGGLFMLAALGRRRA